MAKKTEDSPALDEGLEEIKELNLFLKLIAIREDCDYIQKELQKVNNQYRPTAYNAVVAQTRKSMQKYRLLILPGDKITITTEKVETKNSSGYRTVLSMNFFAVNADKPEERYEFMACSGGFDSLDKDLSKAYTMAMKNAILKLLLIETGDEEESKYDLPAPPSKDDKKNAEVVTVEQAQELANLCAECGVPQEVVSGQYGAKILAHIPAKDFSAVKARLEDRIKKLAVKKGAGAAAAQ